MRGEGGRVADNALPAHGIERHGHPGELNRPGTGTDGIRNGAVQGDLERERKLYEGTLPLVAEDVAEILVWVASRPAHVNIDEMLIKPVDQAAMHKLYRRKS